MTSAATRRSRPEGLGCIGSIIRVAGSRAVRFVPVRINLVGPVIGGFIRVSARLSLRVDRTVELPWRWSVCLPASSCAPPTLAPAAQRASQRLENRFVLLEAVADLLVGHPRVRVKTLSRRFQLVPANWIDDPLRDARHDFRVAGSQPRNPLRSEAPVCG